MRVTTPGAAFHYSYIGIDDNRTEIKTKQKHNRSIQTDKKMKTIKIKIPKNQSSKQKNKNQK